jgi:predicted transcriptional regulator of viral defense system
MVFVAMQKLTEKIMDSPLKNRIFRDVQLKDLLDGNDASRYGLVHRAMAAGEIVRLKRGIYVLTDRLRDFPCHPFAIAQALVPLSYISFESALSWHGWIPEAVVQIASTIPGRKKSTLEHSLYGDFTFVPLAIKRSNYLVGVLRTQIEQQTVLIASPLRALFDLLYFRKTGAINKDFLSQSLRIEKDSLEQVDPADCSRLMAVYQWKSFQQLINDFAASLTPAGINR